MTEISKDTQRALPSSLIYRRCRQKPQLWLSYTYLNRVQFSFDCCAVRLVVTCLYSSL